MSSTPSHSPRAVPQVMVSSTFTDLKEHRAALIDALHRHKLHANVMENDDAKLSPDVVESSLKMVRDSAAYILVIGSKYGQTPTDPVRNPDKVSITELEFNEAQSLGRPILLFLMGEDHPVKKSDVERGRKEKKLNAFRERAKKNPETGVNRVYSVFNSLEEFQEKIASSLAELCRHVERTDAPSPPLVPPPPPLASAIPRPPAFYASPDYIGRHTFIGRKAELKTLSEWARPSDPTSVLLFEAIGGNGKSMLTWEWAKDEKGLYATKVRDWAGRFWYSFYEKGAVMRNFCQHALAYMTEQPLAAYEKQTTAEMRVTLLAELHRQPWLLILDGLERVLVAYHRIDAAAIPDEEANHPTDEVLERDPCDAIRDEDTELLKALAAAKPSKILISSRLIPRVLLNQAGIPLPGVKPLVLPGLEEADAEELLRSCSIQGASADIRYYLTNYCGNHPLVIGVLAGLINSPGPHRSNFDGWAADTAYGAKLNLASLDLVQSRNHILRAAMEALEPASRQLLSTLALLSNAVDYETVAAFNPHLPPEPETVDEPTKPEQNWRWSRMNDKEKAKLRQQYEAALTKRKAYEQARQSWRDSEAVCEAPKKLAETIQDLERRGLLQYDLHTQRYDLHPVVRGVAAGGVEAEDKDRYGERVVDHYASQPHNPYEQAKTIEDVENGLLVVRTLLKLSRYQRAADAYSADLSNALLFNLEAYWEVLSLLRPFFMRGWDQLPDEIDSISATYLANEAATALSHCGESRSSLSAYSVALCANLDAENWTHARVNLSCIGVVLAGHNWLARSIRLQRLCLEFATALKNDEDIFVSRLLLFGLESRVGQWQKAETSWRLLNRMGRNWSRATYRQGSAEEFFAAFQFRRGALLEEHITTAINLAERYGNRIALRDLRRLRGDWWLEQGEWAKAAASFDEAATMARECRLMDAYSETGLALAKFHLGQFTTADARSEAERLVRMGYSGYGLLAQLWRAIGDLDQAMHHALKGYRRAWADGEPYVDRYELTQTTALLKSLGVEIPNLPSYDPAQDEPFPWEANVRAAIKKLKAAKKKEKNKKKSPDNE